jgi:hypothetical protein
LTTLGILPAAIATPFCRSDMIQNLLDASEHRLTYGITPACNDALRRRLVGEFRGMRAI